MNYMGNQRAISCRYIGENTLDNKTIILNTLERLIMRLTSDLKTKRTIIMIV